MNGKRSGWWRKAERKASQAAFGGELRRQIVGLLHSGRLGPGDRLPSIRELAEQSGLDHRVVADAYRELADAGLVEVRPARGVFVARNGSEAASGEERADWLAQLLMTAWERRISRSSVLDLVHRCSALRLRCGCVESNEDHMVALTSELETDFSLEPVPLRLQAQTGPNTLPPELLEGVDLVVASMFHAEAARAAGAEANKPVVIVNFNPEFTQRVDRRLRAHPVTTVHVDPAYAIRGREYLSVTLHRDRVRFIDIDELQNHPLDFDAPEVMVTRAARRRLGLEDYHLIPGCSVISPDAARDLCCAIAQLSLG